MVQKGLHAGAWPASMVNRAQTVPILSHKHAHFVAFLAIVLMVLAFQAFGHSDDLTRLSFVGLISAGFMLVSTLLLTICFIKYRLSLAFGCHAVLILLVAGIALVRAPFTPVGHISLFKDLFLLCLAVNGMILAGLAARYRLDTNRLLLDAGAAILVLAFLWAVVHYGLPLSIASAVPNDIDFTRAATTSSQLFLETRYTIFETHPLAASDMLLFLALVLIFYHPKRWLLLTIFLACAYAFAGRTAIISFLFCLVLYFSPLSTNLCRLLAFAVLLTVLSAFWFWPLVFPILPGYFSDYVLFLESLNGRMPLWEGTLHHILYYGTLWDIVFGFGREAGREILPVYGLFDFAPVDAHHVFYHTLFARGMVGLTALIVLFWWLLFRVPNKKPKLIIIMFIVLSSINNPKIFEGTFFDLVLILFAAVGIEFPTRSFTNAPIVPPRHNDSKLVGGGPAPRRRGTFTLR